MTHSAAHLKGWKYTKSGNLFKKLHHYHIFLEMNGLVKSSEYTLTEAKNSLSTFSTCKDQFSFFV